MLGQMVMCKAAGQPFELPPDHVGDVVNCPLCGGGHPAPPIIPPPAVRPPIVAGPPPKVRWLKRATLGLTLACGIALGMLAGLAIAAATMPTAEEFRATIASQRADLYDAKLKLATSRAKVMALALEVGILEDDLGSARKEIARAHRLWDDEHKLADENFEAWKKASRQLDMLRNARRYR